MYIKVYDVSRSYAAIVASTDYSQNNIDITICLTQTAHAVCFVPTLLVRDVPSVPFWVTHEELCSRIGACTPIGCAVPPLPFPLPRSSPAPPIGRTRRAEPPARLIHPSLGGAIHRELAVLACERMVGSLVRRGCGRRCGYRVVRDWRRLIHQVYRR
jgi:hypothetical protein